MKQHIFDRAGMPLLFEYEIDPDGVINYQHVYVLDSNGGQHGPDLCSLFNGLWVMVGDHEVQPFLSLVTEDIVCHPAPQLMQ